MNRTTVLLMVAIAFGGGAIAGAFQHGDGGHGAGHQAGGHGAGGQENGEVVKTIFTEAIKEKMDGKDSSMTVVEVTIEPGKAGLPHVHPGPGFVYVVEGEYELGIDDQPTRILKAGEVFYEPTGCLHRVSANPATKGRTRLIAVVLHPARCYGNRYAGGCETIEWPVFLKTKRSISTQLTHPQNSHS